MESFDSIFDYSQNFFVDSVFFLDRNTYTKVLQPPLQNDLYIRKDQ